MEIDLKSKTKSILGYLFYILLGVCLALVLREVLPRTSYTVSGSSMFPTYEDGEKIKATPCKKESEISRYSVVVARYQFPYSRIIKRVVALPGETVYIDDQGVLFVNGEEMEEELVYTNGPVAFSGTAGTEITLGEDEYFLIGDNTDVSLDSRSFGPVKRSSILAVVNT